ncbi:hypothetical protein N8563_00650 [bacterium]|nr:hypothetical protein [bacterium]
MVKTFLPLSVFYQFQNVLPSIFFHSIIKYNVLLPVKYIGSPSCLFEGNNLRILFLDKPVSFVGVVHGGFYGEFKVNYEEDYENNFSDQYFYWGLGSYNIRQNRFAILSPSHRKPVRIVLVGTVGLNHYTSSYCPSLKIIHKQADLQIPILQDKFNKIAKYYFLQHPKSPSATSKFVCNIFLSQMSESHIHSSLFIIDRPGNTFLYRAIYQSIPFVIFFNRSWRSYLTPAFNDLLDFMQCINLVFFWDQQDEFIEHIRFCLSSNGFNGDAFTYIQQYLEHNEKARHFL